MTKRLLILLMALARSLTIMLCTLWFGPLYVFGIADTPSGRSMFSSYVGEAKYNRRKWAYPIAYAIDTLFHAIDGSHNHCVNTYLKYKGLDGAPS